MSRHHRAHFSGSALPQPATHCLEQGVDPVDCGPYLMTIQQLRHEIEEQFIEVLLQLIGSGRGQAVRGVEDVPVGEEARDKRAALEAGQHEEAGGALLRGGRRA